MKNRIIIDIMPGAYLFAAMALLVIPIPWFFAAIFAAMVHEFGHLVALRLCRIRVPKITVGIGGAKITTANLSLKEELLCAVSGPIAGLMASFIFGGYHRFAFCCLVQSLFNLLPIHPFDGSRVLICIISILFGDRFGKTAYHITQVLIILVAFGMVVLFC